VIEDLDRNDLPPFCRTSPTNDSINSDPLKLKDAYHDGKLSKPRFKLRAGKKRMSVISGEVPADDAIAIINLNHRSPLRTRLYRRAKKT